MVSTPQSPYSNEQVSAWLRGLLAIAWADGQFDDREKGLITDFSDSEFNSLTDLNTVAPIDPTELATIFAGDDRIAGHFLRMAVMVAISDGEYSPVEDQLLTQFCQALGQSHEILTSLRVMLQPHSESIHPPVQPFYSSTSSDPTHSPTLMIPVQEWLDHLEIHDPRLAHLLCKMIPSQCPFERDVTLFGRKIAHIPPLCKLNPLYEQLVGLRFRALSYLADQCGEDVSQYC